MFITCHILYVHRIADFENKPYDAHTFNDKFSEQLVHTGAVWSNHVEERNKKYG